MTRCNKVFFLRLFLIPVLALLMPAAVLAQTSRASPKWPLNDNKAVLTLSAALTEEGETIINGLVWRIFTRQVESKNDKNKFALLETSQDSRAKFRLPPGDYILHVTYGRTGLVKQITLGANEAVEERIVLNAGGLKLTASLTDGTLDTNQLSFSVYTDNSEAPVVRNIKTGNIVRLNSRSYHVICQYGMANAIVRSSIKVEAGKLTEVNVQLRAARVNLKLVNPKDRTEITDINWVILNDSGDIVHETTSANASVILAEGNYVALARYKDQTYQHDFSLSSGKDQDLVMAASSENLMDEDALD